MPRHLGLGAAPVAGHPSASPHAWPTGTPDARSGARSGAAAARALIYAASMLILGIILFGMLVGAAAQLILGRGGEGINWTVALAAGLIGSFLGGLLASLLSGDGLSLRPSGIIGSIVGAVVVTAGWHWWQRRGATA